MKSFLFLSESLIGLYIILICLIPIFILMIVAIVLTANKKRKEGKIREEKIKRSQFQSFKKKYFLRLMVVKIILLTLKEKWEE